MRQCCFASLVHLPLHEDLDDMEHRGDDQRYDKSQDCQSALKKAPMVERRLRGKRLDVRVHGQCGLLAGWRRLENTPAAFALKERL
jgi:hypothetical protein